MTDLQTPTEEGKYVYCIIESSTPRSFGRMGIGNRLDEVYTIHYRELAAVASDTPLVVYDPTRENALCHERVQEVVMMEHTVIPMSFGCVFRTEDDIVEFLKDTYDALTDVLHRMRDKIEFGLKVNWDTERVMEEIEQEHEEIYRLKQEILNNQQSSTYFARMQLGRLVERALGEKSADFVRNIYDRLRDSAIASRANKVIGDKMILNAAFLVERENASAFDRCVQEIAQRYEGKLTFRYTGPWPPYNFVNVRVKLEAGDVEA
jgi:gas vesicle protein